MLLNRDGYGPDGRRLYFFDLGGDTPPPPDYTPVANASKESAQIMANLGQNQLDESKRQYDTNMAVAKPVVDTQLGIMKQTADQGQNYFDYMAASQRPVEGTLKDRAMADTTTQDWLYRTMKAAGMATRDLPESMQINPARTEALLRGYFNTWALYGLMISDQALFGDKLPERRADQMPVIRRFYANDPAQHTKYETAFYDLLQESKRMRGTMRELDDMGLKSYADVKEANPLATEAKPLEHAAKSLSGINKDMEAVRHDQALTPAEKRQKLDALTVERNALLKQAVTESTAAQKERKQ